MIFQNFKIFKIFLQSFFLFFFLKFASKMFSTFFSNIFFCKCSSKMFLRVSPLMPPRLQRQNGLFMYLCYEKYDIEQAVEIGLSSCAMCKVLFFGSYCSHYTWREKSNFFPAPHIILLYNKKISPPPPPCQESRGRGGGGGRGGRRPDYCKSP